MSIDGTVDSVGNRAGDKEHRYEIRWEKDGPQVTSIVITYDKHGGSQRQSSGFPKDLDTQLAHDVQSGFATELEEARKALDKGSSVM